MNFLGGKIRQAIDRTNNVCDCSNVFQKKKNDSLNFSLLNHKYNVDWKYLRDPITIKLSSHLYPLMIEFFFILRKVVKKFLSLRNDIFSRS